jgi:hypothetical protein
LTQLSFDCKNAVETTVSIRVVGRPGRLASTTSGSGRAQA